MVTYGLFPIPSPSGRERVGLLFFTEEVELAGNLVYNLLLALACIGVKVLVFGCAGLSVAVRPVIIGLVTGTLQRL